MVHVYKVGSAYPRNREVNLWTAYVESERSKLKTRQERRKFISKRLQQLSQKLYDLHRKAVDGTLKFVGGVQAPIEAAEAQRELLVQFKGELLRLCKIGKGNNYKRIAENIIYQQDEIIRIVIEQQEVYDALHGELAEIAKERSHPRKERMEGLLISLEDHIYVLLVSLDPDKTRIPFN